MGQKCSLSWFAQIHFLIRGHSKWIRNFAFGKNIHFRANPFRANCVYLPVLSLNIRHVQSHANLPRVHIIQILAGTAAGHLDRTAATGAGARLAGTAARLQVVVRAAAAALAGAGCAPSDKLADFVARRGHVVVPVEVRLPVSAGPLQLHALGSDRPGTERSSLTFTSQHAERWFHLISANLDAIKCLRSCFVYKTWRF